MLIIVKAPGLVWGTVMQIPILLGLARLGGVQKLADVLFAAFNCTMLIAVSRFPGKFRILSIAYFLFAFLCVTSAELTVLEDQLRKVAVFPAGRHGFSQCR